MNDSSINNFHAVGRQINKFDGKQAGDFWSGRSSFAMPSACTADLSIPTMQQTGSPGTPQIGTFSVRYYLPRPVQHSRSFLGSEERAPKMDQNIFIKPGWPYARSSMAVRERLCVRSITKITTLR